jgi:hypothetical protein
MHNTYTPSKNEQQPFKKYQAIEPPFEYMEVPYINYEPPRSSKYLICSTFFILIVFASIGGLMTMVSYTDKTTTATTSYSDITMTVSNEYGVYSNENYGWLNGSHFAEPYKTTSISLSTNSSGYNENAWKWSIQNDDAIYTGPTIETVFTKPGTYVVTITNNQFLSNYTSTIIVKYVKRELRALSDADRRSFLKAAAKLWKYSTEEGRLLYGDQFTGISTLVEEHALASNDIRCDQFHEGSGFFTHHFAITQTFESALRAVNPAVSLPYWDFTIEGQEIKDAGENPSYFLEVTPFLTHKWFGSVDEDGHIADSKFAFSQMPKVTDSSVVEPNSYGYVRSYWNNNNDPYVTRHLFDVCGVEPTNKKVPNCQTHYELANTASLAKFQVLSPSDGHGTMHVQLGGMYGGCIEAYQNFSDTWSHLLDAEMTTDEILSHGFSLDEWTWDTRRELFETKVMGEYFHIYRSLWRSHMCAADGTPNLLVCPDSCEDSMDTTECKCQVESLVNGSMEWDNIYGCVLSEHNQAIFDKIFPTEFIQDMVLLVATMPVVEGEMLEAASPADILFWVIHPTIERILSAKRLGAGFAGNEITRWTEEEWYAYSYYSLEENENVYWPEAYTCMGHNATDSVLPSTLQFLDGFMEMADTDADGIVTNWEYYVAIDPNNKDGVDYVFDTFEWSHCVSSVIS